MRANNQGDRARGQTAKRYVVDEANYNKYMVETLATAKPCVGTKGQLIIFSSYRSGTIMDMLENDIDIKGK